MADDRVEAVVVGAGAVGLAVARALAQAGREVAILEAQDAIGTGTSARNSEVIHAGIYYRPNSLKARLCVRGKALLYDFCRGRDVTARRIGKLIVATQTEQIAELEHLQARALANGVADLRLLSAAEAKRDQPALACEAALLSPSSGLLDSHGFMLALLGDAEDAGAFLALMTGVTAIEKTASGFEVVTAGDPPYRLGCRLLVNAAGHGAPALARRIEALPATRVPKAWLAKGNYFRLIGPAPFTRLVYPLPEPGGLGLHITLDLGGQARFGPDVEWVEKSDYSVDPERCRGFYRAIRRYWPDLPDASLEPDYAGLRPKIVGPGMSAGDFIISDVADHGLPGLVNLFGIESPGLTAALAIAEEVAERLTL
ncbi:MAG: NAD(P)/FAD-dependent oxidoreductase [Rhodospirillales bacterium]|nr:NAD(P)/FAD-dependent oxidoreductase [Rhodospirillales bacterium]